MTFGVPDAYAFGYGVTSTQGVEFIDLNPELGEYFGADSVGRVLRLIRTYEEDEPIRFRVIRNGAELVTEGRLD